MHKQLIGTWELVSREGQENPPAARRVFGKRDYSWDDHGRPEAEREQSGKYRVFANQPWAAMVFVTSPIEEKFSFSIDGDELTVTRLEPTIGATTKYRRVV